MSVTTLRETLAIVKRVLVSKHNFDPFQKVDRRPTNSERERLYFSSKTKVNAFTVREELWSPTKKGNPTPHVRLSRTATFARRFSRGGMYGNSVSISLSPCNRFFEIEELDQYERVGTSSVRMTMTTAVPTYVNIEKEPKLCNALLRYQEHGFLVAVEDSGRWLIFLD